jgi:hypothetical protein
MFTLPLALEVLERTPPTLRALLSGLSADWASATEGPDTWSPYDVVGHLIHGERTDWVPRAEIIRSGGGAFEPWNRFAQFEESRGKTLEQLLDEFSALRRENLARVKSWSLTDADMERTGVHPEFGPVTMRQLLSTWVAHDLDHLMQISRVMGKQLREDVGPWTRYLRVVGD